MSKEKEELINIINELTDEIETGIYEECIKAEYRKAFRYGQLDTLLVLKEMLEGEEMQ